MKRGETLNKVNTIKAIAASIMGVLNSIFGVLAIPIVLLVACNIIDYVTGILASAFRGQEISSYKGMKGITKKIGMWLLIVVGAIMDEFILYSVAQLGLVSPFSFMVATIVAVWIICNELISILENLKDMEVPLPEFLVRLTKYIKSQIEMKTEITEEEKV